MFRLYKSLGSYIVDLDFWFDLVKDGPYSVDILYVNFSYRTTIRSGRYSRFSALDECSISI